MSSTPTTDALTLTTAFRGLPIAKPTLLIDADLILYRSCAAAERDIRWDDENHTIVMNETDAMASIDKAVERLTKRFDTDDVLMCISKGRNFRYDVDPNYKANRKGTRKPCGYQEVVALVEKSYKSFSHEGIEADDIMGIFGSRNPSSIVCSADKDLKTVPCTLWDGQKLQKIDRDTADWWFFYQVLVGDTADGYPGLPGVGPKKAEAILNVPRKPEELWRAVKAAYEAHGKTADDAITQARLARILRSEDWDAKRKKPILWSPPE